MEMYAEALRLMDVHYAAAMAEVGDMGLDGEAWRKNAQPESITSVAAAAAATATAVKATAAAAAVSGGGIGADDDDGGSSRSHGGIGALVELVLPGHGHSSGLGLLLLLFIGLFLVPPVVGAYRMIYGRGHMPYFCGYQYQCVVEGTEMSCTRT
jgi:hypothetical protein